MFRSRLKCTVANTQSLNCDNLEKPLLHECSASENICANASSNIQSMDLMTNIQVLINERLVKYVSFSKYLEIYLCIFYIKEFSRT